MVRPSRRRFLGNLTSAMVLSRYQPQENAFRGAKAGEERDVEGITVCWCPPGRFRMGSPPAERGRRPDEAQVEVTLTRGFWTAKREATQGQWKRLIGRFPDRLPSAEFGEGDDFPAYWINFDEAEGFCAELTRRGHRSGALPAGWEFRLPTEAQWEYACRAGTVTATSFGDSLGLHQANFGGESEDRAVRVRGSARQSRQLPGQSVGDPRHARERVGMVPGLLPRAAARRVRSGSS